MIRIENITIYNGLGERFEASSLSFDENGINAIGGERKGESLIDGGGLYCITGLINLHVHLDSNPFKDFGTRPDHSETETAYHAFLNAMEHLRAGTTTVRNMGSRFDVDIKLRDCIYQGLMKGPRIFASGIPLTMTGGHGHSMAHEVDGCDEVRKFSRLQIKKGADVIKLFATGGGMTKGVKPGASQLSEEEMRAACEEARKCGKITAAHAQGNDGIKNAIRAGITTVEHGVELDDEVIAMMLERGVYLVPTLAAPYNTTKHGVAAGIPEWAVKKNQDALIPHRESFTRAKRAGVKIAAGNDAGTPFNAHGDFATELRLMLELGMEFEEVLHCATYMGAEVLNMTDTLGSLAPGKFADFVLVDGDPKENIENLYKVRQVYVAGKLMYDVKGVN